MWTQKEVKGNECEQNSTIFHNPTHVHVEILTKKSMMKKNIIKVRAFYGISWVCCGLIAGHCGYLTGWNIWNYMIYIYIYVFFLFGCGMLWVYYASIVMPHGKFFWFCKLWIYWIFYDDIIRYSLTVDSLRNLYFEKDCLRITGCSIIMGKNLWAFILGSFFDVERIENCTATFAMCYRWRRWRLSHWQEQGCG